MFCVYLYPDMFRILIDIHGLYVIYVSVIFSMTSSSRGYEGHN
jgi:hypothetical protein